MNIEEAIEHLKEVSPYEGTEAGETWDYLIRIWESYRDYVSDAFRTILEREIIDQALYAKQNYVIEETETVYRNKIKHLTLKH